MAVTDFVANITAMAAGFVDVAMDAGTHFATTEPYSYIIAGALGFSAIALGVGFLLKRKGKKGRR